MLKDQLDRRPDIQPYLFGKGFLITNDYEINTSQYPFYGNWEKNTLGGFHIFFHKDTHYFYCTEGKYSYFLIGHAYNPFAMEVDEIEILKNISKFDQSKLHPSYIDELTGVFILGRISKDEIRIELDCSGMQYGCYGTVDNKVYIASHMQLIGDLCHLPMDEYVKRLVNYRWYHYMMGNYLPGELTCFRDVKRIIPNTYVDWKDGHFIVTRFYPNRKLDMCDSENDYRAVIQEAASIMQKTMTLIPQKWKKPAISLTGGIDSNTTFAAANGDYEKYSTFSYISMFRESVDADAAKIISDQFHVPHAVYRIPESNDEVKDFELFKEIFTYNNGDIGRSKDDDTRKKIVLIQNDVCDVEVKSWISETIRAYAYKYFGRKHFPNDLKPRHYTSLYKIFFMNRRLVWETDRSFGDYIKHTNLKSHLFNYDESDLFVWEMMHGGKCGLNIGVMKLCFDITIPYNNRKLLDLLLRVPLGKRLSDQHHLDLKKHMNQELYDMNIRVVNLNETNRRKKFANAYFTINSSLPF